MGKLVVADHRYDFRGGRNTAVSPDLLNPNELVDTTSARLTSTYGAISKRSGTQRMHQTAFPFAIQGLYQWDGPSGKQLVVIANGQLYYRNGFTYSTAFTAEGTTPFSTSQRSYFTPFRDSSSGAALVLFIASNGKLFKWTGTVLTEITGTTLPADRIVAYHTRVFYRNSNFKKHLYWSKVGDATSLTTGLPTDGGSAMVDVLSGEEIVALEVIGSSLLIVAEDSIMRFTGHSNDEIVIAQDTEGISSEVGAPGQLSIVRFENAAALFNERGPYAVTETYVQPLGEQVVPDFATMTQGSKAFFPVGYNRGTKELSFAFGTAGSANALTVMVYSTRLQCWYGPWVYTSAIHSFARYEDSNGNEKLIASHADGFVRDMSVGSLDDVLYDNSGGSNISMTVELPVIHFNSPGSVKSLRQVLLQAAIPSTSNISVKASVDGGAFTAGSFVDTTFDNVERSYRVDIPGVGRRIRLQITDTSAGSPTIYGVSTFAYDMNRA